MEKRETREVEGRREKKINRKREEKTGKKNRRVRIFEEKERKRERDLGTCPIRITDVPRGII